MSSTINLYVDDLRDCPSGFTVARNIEEAIHYFENWSINILSLDHDLGEDDEGNLLPTGYDFVKIFCERGYRANKIYIHTDNGVGRANMFHTLKGAQRRGFKERIPGSKTIRIVFDPGIQKINNSFPFAWICGFIHAKILWASNLVLSASSQRLFTKYH
ncbi:cyclic-phosphate processing receiver domain-containing protein [Planococcus lenghuensis]|uniref:cyclic-phosphate processing receiver domain-containing protein n=1 Tax=Planococcus lenghuensis TaxID=2213202 RepID=UPI0026A86DB1